MATLVVLARHRCKGRGFCPSCTNRRAVETGVRLEALGHLVMMLAHQVRREAPEPMVTLVVLARHRCKGRGFCPSCTNRRAVETGVRLEALGHLVMMLRRSATS